MSAPGGPIWERWEEIDGLFERLLEVDAGQRESELSRLSRGDPVLERMLMALLDASDEGGWLAAGPTPLLVNAALDEKAPQEALPDRVGPYSVIARLGRGGMGSVFLAERDDPSFRNRVAVKLLRRGVDTDDVLARFRAERQILASLHHPGIATVFDAGTSDDGRPFLVLEYVEGSPVTEHCDAHRLDVRARLRLLMAVLRAVSHAHAHGVVHRDLKPSNILVTKAESHVKLLDFGIAKVLDPGDPGNDVEPTGPGRRPMTPGFASPEQILGLPITAASDIYQLGLLLHELLTGTRPFDDCSPRDYERSVTTTLPDPPSRVLLLHSGAVTMSGVADRRALSRILKGDLDAIVLHCLHRDPAARYESVDALHEDIASYLEGRPVAARRATAMYRVEKLLRRRAHRLVLPLVPVLAIAASWLVLDRSLDAGATATPVPKVAAGGIVDQVAGVSTSSPQAYRLYIEGLAAYRTGDNRIADRFFHAALEEDSMFALAASYASRAIYDENPQAGRQLLNRAYRLADHASDRERLVIRARWASAMEDPLLGAFADSLVRRFPAEPEGQYLLGLDLFHAGHFFEAVGHLERAVALDSLSLHATRAPCVACDALARMAFSYVQADSMAAAVRVSERWTRLQPGSALAWQELAASLLRAGRYDEAIEARGRAATLRVGDALDALFPGVVAINRGDFEEADRLFRLHLGTGTPMMRIEAAHWLAISLRTQGRWNAALQAAEALLDASRLVSQDYSWDVLGQIHRALALLGSGRPDEAARVFEASVRSNDEFSVSRLSRDHAWYLTQAGTAWAAAGDTARLAALADRVESVGARSIYGRDQRLHHYLRALLARTRRAPEAELEGHLRDALFSLPFGYSRINLELAESLLGQQRHEDAAAVAGAALRNSIQSNGMYATRTDFHELLGRIWHAAGEADSAAVHIRAALHGWRAADPILQPRVAHLESLLASLEQEGAALR